MDKFEEEKIDVKIKNQVTSVQEPRDLHQTNKPRQLQNGAEVSLSKLKLATAINIDSLSLKRQKLLKDDSRGDCLI